MGSLANFRVAKFVHAAMHVVADIGSLVMGSWPVSCSILTIQVKLCRKPSYNPIGVGQSQCKRESNYWNVIVGDVGVE